MAADALLSRQAAAVQNRQGTADALLIDGPALARLLSVGISTLHSLRRAGRLPLSIVRLSRCVRYDRREVERWIAAGCPAAAAWRAMNTK